MWGDVMKNKIVLLLAVSLAVLLFVAFRSSGLEELPVIGAALSLYHCKHFVGVVCGLVNRLGGVKA